jgi:hypothetical protein
MTHRVGTGECLIPYFYCGSVKQAAQCSQNRMIRKIIKNELRIMWKEFHYFGLLEKQKTNLDQDSRSPVYGQGPIHVQDYNVAVG